MKGQKREHEGNPLIVASLLLQPEDPSCFEAASTLTPVTFLVAL
jgi:hypothetical protein